MIQRGKFTDDYRGNGLFIAFRRFTLALRWRWHFYSVRPPGKPGYRRTYIGPLEIETRRRIEGEGE